MKITMVCVSAQPTAQQHNAEPGGARVLLVEQAAAETPAKGARLEMFLLADQVPSVTLGQTFTVTVT